MPLKESYKAALRAKTKQNRERDVALRDLGRRALRTILTMEHKDSGRDNDYEHWAAYGDLHDEIDAIRKAHAELIAAEDGTK